MYRVECHPERKTEQMGYGYREVNRQPVVIISAPFLFPNMSFAIKITTYLDTFEELDDTRYDDKSNKKGNCPRPLGYV